MCRIYFTLFLLSILPSHSAFAQDAVTPLADTAVEATPQLDARRETIEAEQAKVEREKAELDVSRKETARELDALRIGDISRAMVEQAELDAVASRVDLEGIELELQQAKQKIADIRATIKELQARSDLITMAPGPSDIPPAEVRQLRDDLTLSKAALQLEKQHLANLQIAFAVASQGLQLAVQKSQELRALYKTKSELSDKDALAALQARIQEEQRELSNQAVQLRQRLDAVAGAAPEAQAERARLRLEIQQAEELAKFKQTESRLAQGQARLKSLSDLPPTADSIVLALGLDELQILFDEFTASGAFIERKLALLKQQKDVLDKRAPQNPAEGEQIRRESTMLGTLIAALDTQSKQANFMIESTAARLPILKSDYEASLRRGLLGRQNLPTTLTKWRQLGEEFLMWPMVLWRGTLASLNSAVAKTNPADLGWIVVIELAWLSFWFAMRVYLTKMQARLHTREPSFVVKVLSISARWLRANILGIALAGALFIVLLLAAVPMPGFGIILLVVGSWLIYKLAIDLARLVLSEGYHRTTRGRIFHALRWGLLFLAVLTVVMVFGHISPVSPMMQGVIDRLFMLCVIPVFLIVLRYRKLLTSPLESVLTTGWLHTARLAVLIVPLILLLSAVIGVLGYINLAWAIAKHIGLFLLVLGGWLLLRGLLRDLFNLLQRYAARQAETPMWSHTLLEPLRRLSQFGMYLLAWWVLFRVYGWTLDSPIIRDVRRVMTDPLFHVGGKPVHLLGILLTIIIMIGVVWLGRWSREFTYRWLFFKISNTGARQSLSVFSQYFVVLVGFLIALRVLGIDLTTLTVFAGALGVGIGFGLQNVANNFISGILLLIERPVRVGDTVTIGASQGAVTRIGIRSLTVKTSDSQDVIIPNSEVISHPFTNWTYSDTLARSTAIVGIHYESDAHRAHGIIEQALRRHPAVLQTPAPEVWLEEFTHLGVMFRLQYFTDLSRTNGQEVKSALLFQIADGFQDAGVRFLNQPIQQPNPAPAPPNAPTGESP